MPPQLNVLGPVELLDGDGRPVAIGGPTQRGVLTYLALHRGRVVSTDDLLEAVWPGIYIPPPIAGLPFMELAAVAALAPGLGPIAAGLAATAGCTSS